MAAEERLIEEITFSGGQNTDFALEHIAKGDYLDALNIITSSSGEGNIGMVKNLKGNKQIVFTLPEGINKCIGTAQNSEHKKFYFFIYNSLKSHGIYQYNALDKTVTAVLINLQHTGGEDILNFDPNHLILHAEVVNNNLLYWVDGFNNARKINIDRVMDKTVNGLGNKILQSYIDQYKQTARLAPTAKYATDTAKPYNKLYGRITKYAQRFTYLDGEKSTFSDFSGVILPDKEPFNGLNGVTSTNNRIDVTVNTGSREVKTIEIVMQSTTAELNDESILNWVLIATLDKKKMNLPDNADYVYPFYNDGNYPAVNPKDIIQPYSFMFKKPLCQTVAKMALVQSNGYEGFPVVDVDVTASVTYADLFVSNGTENILNSPFISINSSNPDYVNQGESATKYDGTVVKVPNDEYRCMTQTIVIGNDVKKGNIFRLSLSNGFAKDMFNISYTAKASDTAASVASNLKQKLIATGRIYRKTEESPEANIYENTFDGNGNVTFKYIIMASDQQGYINGTASVAPVSYAALKDTGESIKNIKMGSSIKYGIEYEDFDGRKSLVYTDDNLVVNIKTINEAGGVKLSKINLQIHHKPPLWAKYYQIVRTNDLRYSDFTQILVEKAVDLPTTTQGNSYMDLVISSFFTYKKIHPGSSLSYQFENGDRVVLIKKTDDNTYYPFYETEVIAYNETVTDRVNSNITINGTANVVVAQTFVSNIGKTILVDGSSREIVAVLNPTTYTLNNTVGNQESKTFLYYDLVDNRGTLRIKKPPVGVIIADNTVIEVYKPYKASGANSTFYEFQKKFVIDNPGTENAYHSSDKQSQTASLPAIVEITEGTAYVRNREMPLANVFPGTPVLITSVEDPSFSDFYPSLTNDNGRPNAQDTGLGEVHFGSRMRFSNNLIEDTSINGLNNFENLNREDYNDIFGDVKMIKYDGSRIYTFKELKTAFVWVGSKMVQDKAGSELLVGTDKLLNQIQYYAWEGGVGNNPESYSTNGTHRYFVSANSGVVIRLAANGEEPISKTFFVDSRMRAELAKASLNGYKIFTAFNSKLGLLTISIHAPTEQDSKTYVFNEGTNRWIGTHSYNPEYYCKFLDSLFSFKLGRLWEHDVNPIHNNFYGQQYTSKISFVANESYQRNKLYYVMKIDSDGRWAVPKIITPKNETWPNGMRSRLHENNFDLYNGKYWADFLMDMNDPNFTDELKALFEGRYLVGAMLICDIECKETKETKLNGVFIYSSEQKRNF